MPAIRSLGGFSILLLLAAPPVQAGCIEEAARHLHPGTVLMIQRADGSIVSGTYLRSEAEPLRFVLSQRLEPAPRDPATLEFAASEISRIDVPSRPVSAGKWLIIGGVAGGFLFAVFARILQRRTGEGSPLLSPPSQDEMPRLWSPNTDTWPTTGFGMAVGLVAGALTAAGGSSPRHWSCAEVAANAPAIPDSTRSPVR